MMMDKNFETTSRKLEQFLFVHDIQHESFYKNEDNMTVWVYPNSEEVQEVVAEYRKIVARRKERALNQNPKGTSRVYVNRFTNC